MKTVVIMFLTGVAFVAASPVFAGRDQLQMILLQQAIEKQKAENLASARQSQTGLAGPAGVAGKVGPGTQRARRDPSAHP